MLLLRGLGLQAIAGGIVWVAAAVVGASVAGARLDLVDLLLLFGQLVVVPMALLLFASASPLAEALQLNARILFRFGALAALVAALLPPGALAALLAAMWLLPTGFAGLAALAAAIARREVSVSAAARLLAGGFLVASGAFFVLHRAGGEVLGFSPVVIELTAIHFTFTGYGLLTVGGEVTAWTRRQQARLAGGLARGGTAGLIIGLLVTPLGFVTGQPLQVIGAGVVAVSLVPLAMALALVAVYPATPRLARAWLLVSPLALVAVAMLGLAYALSEAMGSPMLAIQQMAATHGLLAAFGVVGCGLLGWRLVRLLD